MATSASSRSAAEPAGAGRSASERAGIGAASRARVTTASMVVDDPVARCVRSAPSPAPPSRQAKPTASVAPSVRAPSSPRTKICQQQFAKKKNCRVGQHRSRPGGPSRSKQHRAASLAREIVKGNETWLIGRTFGKGREVEVAIPLLAKARDKPTSLCWRAKTKRWRTIARRASKVLVCFY